MIRNLTKKNIIAQDHRNISSLFGKARGLMFTTQANQHSLLFRFNKEQYIPLHMYFVFFSIDVVYLNKNKEVVETKESLKPFHFHYPKEKAQYVLELHEGTIREKDIAKGDLIQFE